MVIRLLVFDEVHAIGIVGGENNVVAIEVLDASVSDIGDHPTSILVHSIVDDKKCLSASKRGFDKDSWI